MKRLSAFLLVLCLFVFVALAFGQQTQTQTQQGKPKMVIEQLTFDAGDIYRGGAKSMVEHTFIIKNTGTAPLQIFKAQPG